MRRVVLLGPQRFEPNLSTTIDALGCAERLAVVTAGWQEREDETEELARHVDREIVNLRLYRRAEQIMAEDEELAAALRQRQEGLRQLQALYRLRLSSALDAARILMRRTGHDGFVDEHRRAAIRAVRTLDRQHLVRVRKIHEEFDQRWQSAERAAVRRHRESIAEELERASALAIAGGHVAVLLNRLRLFDILDLEPELPVIAWSAGAMALSERVVLFHDSPPQGPGDAEVFEWGFGGIAGVLPLPHATRRLRLDDPWRVALFARRFAPATCVALEPGTRLDWDGRDWIPRDRARALSRRGTLREMVPS
jgi:hypothetical protein